MKKDEHKSKTTSLRELSAFILAQMSARGWVEEDLSRKSFLPVSTIRLAIQEGVLFHGIPVLYCLAHAFTLPYSELFLLAGINEPEAPLLPIDQEVYSLSKTVGEYIRAETRRRGWTLFVLHEKSGLSEGVVSMVLSGKRSPSPYTLISIAGALRITPEVLLDKANYSVPNDTILPLDESLLENAKSFTEFITAERERRHWTLTYLAHKAGLSHGGLSMMLSGERVPSFLTLTSLALAFDYPEDILINNFGLTTPDGQGTLCAPSELPGYILDEIKNRNISKADFCKITGLSHQGLCCALVSGHPNDEIVEKIAAGLNVSINLVYGKMGRDRDSVWLQKTTKS